jgi:hypothetical protein
MFCLSGQKGRDAMKTDHRIGGGASAPHYRHPLVFCITRFLTSLQRLPDPAAKRNVWWTPLRAALAAVLMVFDRGCALRVRFEDARECMAGDFSRNARAGQTYNGLLKALQRQASTVLPLLKRDLRRQAQERFARWRHPSQWLLLAVDGSKENLSRTESQEEVFGIADNGRGPQALITVIVEVLTGVLWDWRIDRGRGSEKSHLQQMAPELPENALLLGDGNFVGFPIWSQLDQAGQRFLIRVGGNVRLLSHLWPEVCRRRQGDFVYVWPKKSRHTTPPLPLRLIRIGRGVRAVYLLTNVLDSQRLSRREAGAIYRLRWGVEVTFRTLKCTLGYAKLRSRSGQRARIELEWALIAMTIMSMMGMDAARRHRVDPTRLSPAHLSRTLRHFLLRGVSAAGTMDSGVVHRRLVSQLKDTYHRRRSKASRHRPRTRNTPKPLVLKPPIIRRATKQERQIAQQYQKTVAA